MSDDSTSGIANNIWPIFLRVLSYTQWKTVGTIIGDVNLIYGVTVDQARTATSESYHSYSYYLKDGDYYKDGYWYTGARVEQRVTYASGWSMYYDTAGVPHSNWEPQGWQYLTEEAGCHWNDHTWILGHASNAYTPGTPMITEAYNACSIWNP